MRLACTWTASTESGSPMRPSASSSIPRTFRFWCRFRRPAISAIWKRCARNRRQSKPAISSQLPVVRSKRCLSSGYWRPAPGFLTEVFDMKFQADLFESIRTRRTTNGAFKPDAIDPEHLKTILEMASHAPSHFNSQPWRFIIVQDDARRAAIADIAGDSMRMLIEEGTFWKRYSKYFRFSQDEIDRTSDGIHFDNMPSVLKPFARYVLSPKGSSVIN